MKTHYAVARLVGTIDLKKDDRGEYVSVDITNNKQGIVGFIPVFETEKAAKDFGEDEAIWELQTNQ